MKFVNNFSDTKIISGIYKIVNLTNEKFYIGSTNNFKLRFSAHLSMLKSNRHRNTYLQRSFNKHGRSNFIFEVIEIVEDINTLIEREQFWIDTSNVKDKTIGYNICLVAGNTMNKKHSEETKDKIRIKATGRKPSDESKKKNSDSNLGRKVSKETREKISNIKKGKKRNATKEEREECAKRLLIFRHLSQTEEAREKTRQKLIGRHYHTDDSKRRMSENHWKNRHTSKAFKLNEEKVIEIKRLLKLKTKHKDIASQFSISETTVARISQGRQWGHIVID